MVDYDIYCISGESMAPLLEKGTDAVIIEKVPFADIKKHDIIAFLITDNPVSNVVCHRVYKRKLGSDTLLEKGDHHFEVTTVSSKQYVGKVSHIIKNGFVYTLKNKRNQRINRMIGMLANCYQGGVSLYLLFHPGCTIKEISVDKAFRRTFFKPFRYVAKVFVAHMQAETQNR